MLFIRHLCDDIWNEKGMLRFDANHIRSSLEEIPVVPWLSVQIRHKGCEFESYPLELSFLLVFWYNIFIDRSVCCCNEHPA